MYSNNVENTNFSWKPIPFEGFSLSAGDGYGAVPTIMELDTFIDLYKVFSDRTSRWSIWVRIIVTLNEYRSVVEDCCRIAIEVKENLCGLMMAFTAP